MSLAVRVSAARPGNSKTCKVGEPMLHCWHWIRRGCDWLRQPCAGASLHMRVAVCTARSVSAGTGGGKRLLFTVPHGIRRPSLVVIAGAMASGSMLRPRSNIAAEARWRRMSER